MTMSSFGELILNREEYEILKNVLAEHGVVLKPSMTDCKTYTCYIRNPAKEVIGLWGSDLEKKLEKEFIDNYERF